MKPSNFTNFLEQGALLRTGIDNWFLMEGPFQTKTQLAPHDIALFSPEFFAEGPAKYWIPKAFYRLTTNELASLCSEALASVSAPWSWQEAKFESFSSSFHEISERIRGGSLKKAVPIVFEKSSVTPSPEARLSMIRALLKAPANLFAFGFWQGSDGILGATPEVLLKQSSRKLETMALAGTCPKADVAQRVSLLEDPKERLEHDLVVQDILQSLNAYGNLKIHGPQILELPTLFHLKTDIQCELNSDQAFSFFEACQRLHPTPALGVSPRSYGYEWMKSLPEQKERAGFGAPWGMKWSEEEALCLVAIRNLQWNKEGSRIGSGCGVVAQSDLQQEWRELLQKRQSVKKVLGLES
jgi:isochorismate synthase EntC